MKLLIICLFISCRFISAGEIREIAEGQILEFFGPEVIFSLDKVSIDSGVKSEIEKKARQRFFRDNMYVWKVSQSDTVTGYVFMDNVLGKSMPITFLVIFDTMGTVRATRVVKYREAYGGAVANHSWLNQFINMSAFDIDIKKIDTITGATISVKALTRGVKKLTLLFPFVKNKIN